MSILAKRPAHRPRLRDRVVILGFCAWLFGSWLTCLTIDSVLPAVRWMIFACLVGLTVIWPLLRLSETAERAPIGPVARDAIELALLWQLAIWPLWLSAEWPLTACLWLNGTLTAWTLLAGAVAAAGRLCRRGGARAAAMVGLLALLVGEPVLMALPGLWGGAAWHWVMRISPLELVWSLANGAPDVTAAGARVGAIGAAAVLAWSAVVIGDRGR